MSLHEQTAHELAKRLAQRELSAVELAEAVFDRVGEVEPRVGAYLTLTRAQALAQAAAVDARRAKGETLGPLAGIPLAVKDNLATRDVQTTCGSRILENFKPVYDAFAVQQLNEAGTVLVGKTNMDEFGMGSSTENSSFKVTHNPWDLARVPGGSSGGSAAAVATGTAIIALGSDTGGSIRQPAAFCGVVGIKPTYGLVSRRGLVAYASSLDCVGPITRDVRDGALVLSAIARHDAGDSTSIPSAGPKDYTLALEKGVQGLRVGIITELMGDGIAPEVRAAVAEAVRVLEQQGAKVDQVSLPHSDVALATYYVVAMAEASSNLARYDGVRYGERAPHPSDLLDMYRRTRALFGQEVKRRIMLGTYALAAGYFDAYYKKALQVRTLIQQDYAAAFEQFDVLVSPVAPTTAFKLGEKTDDPLAMYLADIATIPVNLAGVPAMSLPCGFDTQGLPIGLQLTAKPLAEETLLAAAYAFEQATTHHLTRPMSPTAEARS